MRRPRLPLTFAWDHREAFERWWGTLPPPMKRDKADAEREWARIWKDGGRRRWLSPEGMCDFLIERVRLQVEARHWQGKFDKSQDFIPHASTYLHKGQYDDEIIPANHQRSQGASGWTITTNRVLTPDERAALLATRGDGCGEPN